MRKKSLGNLGENLALKHLHKQGYTILERNFRSKFGEVDIIAQDGEVLVFIEVKTRWSQKYGPPEEAITPGKIKRIIKVSQYYKMLHPQSPEAMRIDAVAIDLSPSGGFKEIKVIRNLTG